MGRLSIYLPPFASDYTGVCSALFDLHAFVAINDAGCCTNHYVFCDEPRWAGEVRPIFSTALRSIRAILGTDERLVDELASAADGLDAQLAAVVGTPVPAITGMDMAGIAAEVEARRGRPALGFDTTGFSYYDKGVALAGRVLIDRFASAARDGAPVPGRVNVLGCTPLDYGANGNDGRLARAFERQGLSVGARLFMGADEAQINHMAQAEMNIAVSSAGVDIARHCERRFGTPYRVDVPFAAADIAALGLDRAAQAAAAAGGRVLIVADQVMGNALRAALLHGRGEAAPPVDVASFFGWHTRLAQTGDVHLKDEASYLALLRSGAYAALVADPLLIDVPAADGLVACEFVHPAVSGKLAWDRMPVLFS